MQNVTTKYGVLKGVTSLENYSNGSIKECNLDMYNELLTEVGLLIPQYENNGVRKKYVRALSFYESGNLKSLSLQEQTQITTPIGTIPADLVTFYESGKLKRVFPLNGAITGYWTEEDEYGLAKDFSFDFSFGTFQAKPISVYFYETGVVKSVTLWPQETVVVDSPIGKINTRTGISLYADGSLHSVEPTATVSVTTPLGSLMAYNPDSLGIHGDSNSLVFSENGALEALTLSTQKIIVQNKSKQSTIYSPGKRPSMTSENEMEVDPLHISFHQGNVRFSGAVQGEHALAAHTFSIQELPAMPSGGCSDCSSCSGCS